MIDLQTQTIGACRIETPLGSDDQGRLFRARRLRSDQSRAVKIIHPAHARVPGFRQAFQQELPRIAALRHPGIVQVFDFGEQDGLFFVTLELLPQVSLRTLLQHRAQMQPDRFLALGLDLLRQAAAALAFAHAQGVVHRNLKPTSLLVQSEQPGQYQLKLTAFGLPIALDQEITLEEQPSPDTLIYTMSPEQFRGLEPDARSDIYALGMLLYEVVTGSPPLQVDTLDAAVFQHVYAQPTAPRQVRPDIPADLEALILRCLQKDPAARFQTADELAHALGAIRPDAAPAPATAPVQAGPDQEEQPATASPFEQEAISENQGSSSVIGTYQLIEPLGSGRLGQVFTARRFDQATLHVVKLVHAYFAADPGFQAQFQPQVRPLAALRHPNLVRIVDFGEQNGRLYLAMEWVADGSLQTLLQQQAATPLPLALDLMRQAADGLAYLHDQGHLHRNLKPANLLLARRDVSESGSPYQVKLSDVGLAHLADPDLTDPGRLTPETLRYSLVPETCQGRPPDARSDIYALGLLLYELVTGRPRIDATTPDAAVAQHLHPTSAPPRQVRPDISAGLEAIILRCLNPDPDARFAGAADLSRALQIVQRGFVTSAPAPANPPVEPAVAPGEPAPPPAAPPLPFPQHLQEEPAIVPVEPAPLSEASPAPPPQPALPEGGIDPEATADEESKAPDLSLQNLAIEELLGRGALGEVFRAHHRYLDRDQAVKFIYPHLSRNLAVQERFRAEISRVAALQHPNIVEIFDFGEHDGRLYVTMELLEEGSLRTLLQRRARAEQAWPLAHILDLLHQAAEALAFAHEHGSVHRNLKPDNLLLTRQDQFGSDPLQYTLKVSDFGLRQSAEELAETPDEAAIDTLAYAPPEWFQQKELDARSDIYALGIILYEIATRYPPFDTGTFALAYRKHVQTPPPAPRQVRPDLPVELESIILRCLAKDPAERFATAADLATAIEGVVLKYPAPARAPHPSLTPGGAQATLDPNATPSIHALSRRGRTIWNIELSGDGLAVGRAADNDAVLDAPAIADYHLQIDWDGNRVSVINLGPDGSAALEGIALTSQVAYNWRLDTMLHLAGIAWLRLELPSTPAVQPADLDAAAPFPAAAALPEPFPPVSMPPPPPDNPVVAAPPLINAPDQLEHERSITQPTANVDRIGVVLDQDSLKLIPGRPEVCRLTLANLGQQVDHFTVTVDGVPEEWLAGAPPVVQLNPGAQTLVTLNIAVPMTPESRAGNYPVTIRARSREIPSESGSAPATWMVASFTAGSLEIKPRRQSKRGKAPYTVIVSNAGNAPATYTLSGSDDEEALDYRFPNDRVTLEPGNTLKIKLTVRPQGLRWFGDSYRHNFTIQAQPEQKGELQTAGAQYEQLALLTRALLMLIFIPPLIIGALMHGYGRLPIPLNAGRGFLLSPTPTMTGTATATPTVTPTSTPSPTDTPTVSPTDLPQPEVQQQPLQQQSQPTPSPAPTDTPVTPTTAPTVTPTPRPLACLPGRQLQLAGQGPPNTPFLVYFDPQTGPAELPDPLIPVGGGVTNSSGAFVVTLDLQRTNAGPYTISVRPRGARLFGVDDFTINQVGTGRTGLQPIQPHIQGNLISSDQITCEVPGTPTVTPAPTETDDQAGEEGESGEEEEEEAE